jgi:50S ribosomal subunit-associated GTPase HflX
MATVYGNLQGLKTSQIKQLERLYEEVLPGDCFITSEFAEQVTALSQAIHQSICCYINRRGQAMSRLGAGIGTRGLGETKLETERRTIQRRIAQLRQEVNQLQVHRARLRQQRERQEIPTIALVGYTNAAKLTLLNVLTQSEIYTAELPATLPDAMLVFNKIDRTDSATLAQAQQNYPNATFISATEQLGLETLRQRLVQLVDVTHSTLSDSTLSDTADGVPSPS